MGGCLYLLSDFFKGSVTSPQKPFLKNFQVFPSAIGSVSGSSNLASGNLRKPLSSISPLDRYGKVSRQHAVPFKNTTKGIPLNPNIQESYSSSG